MTSFWNGWKSHESHRSSHLQKDVVVSKVRCLLSTAYFDIHTAYCILPAAMIHHLTDV